MDTKPVRNNNSLSKITTLILVVFALLALIFSPLLIDLAHSQVLSDLIDFYIIDQKDQKFCFFNLKSNEIHCYSNELEYQAYGDYEREKPRMVRCYHIEHCDAIMAAHAEVKKEHPGNESWDILKERIKLTQQHALKIRGQEVD